MAQRSSFMRIRLPAGSGTAQSRTPYGCYQVAVRRLAVGEPELAAEVPGRHVRAAGERLDVQRLRVLPVDPVADPAQPREVAQVLRRGGSAGYLRDRATYDCM